jgi:hypothetical protein
MEIAAVHDSLAPLLWASVTASAFGGEGWGQ